MISAVIITLNEEKNITDCIISLKPVVHEVIVVDALSTDNTVVLAEKAGAVVHSQEWKGYGNARNKGASLATYNWILSFDADERATSSMVTALANETLEENCIYLLKRVHIYANSVMQYGMLHPEWKERLYHRSGASWDLRSIHEQLKHPPGTELKRLPGMLFHHAYDNYSQMIAKLDGYAQLKADDMKQSLSEPNNVIQFFGPAFHFIKSYLIQFGFLEGRRGLETSKAAYEYVRKTYNYYNSGY